MLITEQFAAVAAIDAPIIRLKPLSARWFTAFVIRSALLPMRSCDHLIWFWPCWLQRRCSRTYVYRLRRIIGLEHIKALELLVEDGKWLKPLGLYHLRLEPVLDLVLLDFFKVLVGVV